MTSQLTGSPVAVTASPRRRAIGLALVLTVQLMLILDMSVVNVALPKIRVDLGFSASTLSWVLSAYTLTFGGLLLLGGRLGDTLGRRRTFLAGLAVFTLGSLLGGLAASAPLLVAARALQGVGAAVAAPSVLALVTTSAQTPAARNRALALFSAVSSAGGSIGLLLGGVLTGYASWRWSLFVNVPIGLAVLALTRRFVSETAPRPGRFDLPGAVTATLGSAALVFAFVNAPDHGWGSVGTLGGFALAAVLLGAFVHLERSTSSPVLDLGLLRDRARAGAVSVMALFVGAQFAFFFFAVQFMQGILGYGALRSGLAFLPPTLLILATSRFTPRLVARLGVRPLVLVGLSMVAASNLWLSGLDATSGYALHLLPAMLLTGVGAGLTFMPLTVAMLGNVAPEQAGSASGLLQMGQQVGGSLGLAVLVTIFASHVDGGGLVQGLGVTFEAATGFLLAAAVLATVLLGTRRRPAPPHVRQAELEPAA
jgi:EmrB/QacA subfamily drug resistance transporter